MEVRYYWNIRVYQLYMMLYNYCLNSYTLLRIYESRECVQMLTAHSISHHHQTISTKDILSLMLGHLFREGERERKNYLQKNQIQSNQ